MKNKRVVDESLLDTVRNLPCMGCASLDPEGARASVFENEVRSHPHHLISRGAGGGDVAKNLMPLCWNHHAEVHRKGLAEFSQSYILVHRWLELADWTFFGSYWEAPQDVYGREEVTHDA